MIDVVVAVVIVVTVTVVVFVVDVVVVVVAVDDVCDWIRNQMCQYTNTTEYIFYWATALFNILTFEIKWKINVHEKDNDNNL